VDIEDLPDEELGRIADEFRALHERAERERSQRAKPSSGD
jgi:hypothetical protein